MPSRVVRESILHSDRYHSVSIEGRLFFFEALLTADDYGLLHLSPTWLKMHCPVVQSLTRERLLGLIDELMDVDLIRVYEVDGTRYGYIPRFRNWPQAVKPKFPIPPDEIGGSEIKQLIEKRHNGKGRSKVSKGNESSVSIPSRLGETETETETEEKKTHGPAGPVDPVGPTLADRIFTEGLRLLTSSGESTAKARGVLAKVRKLAGDEKAVALIATASAKSPALSDPASWLLKAANGSSPNAIEERRNQSAFF